MLTLYLLFLLDGVEFRSGIYCSKRQPSARHFQCISDALKCVMAGLGVLFSYSESLQPVI